MSLNRYIQLLESRNQRFEVIDDKLFIVYQNMVVPFGPFKKDYTITNTDAKLLLNKLGGWLVRHTNGITKDEHTEWYAVICDKFQSLDELKSKYRSEINRGIKNCEVKRIDAKYFATNFYEVYHSAQANYGSSVNGYTEQQFKQFFKNNSSFDDIIHTWGVFVNNKPVAFSTHYIYDKLESSITSVKINPAYNSHYPSYALFYRINEYYLHEQQFSYVNDGFRSILHDTNVQDYLIKKFNFKKAYTKLSINYKWPFGSIIKTTYPFKSILSKVDKRLEALYELERASRT